MSLGVISAHDVVGGGGGGSGFTVAGVRRTSKPGTGLSMTVLFPTGLAEGDLMVMHVSASSTFTGPTTWTVGGTSNPGSWIRGGTFYKVATATDVTDGSKEVTTSAQDSAGAVVTAIRGGATALAIIYQLATREPGDPSEAVSIPAGSGHLIYAALSRQGTSTAVDRGALLLLSTADYYKSVARSEDAGGAVTATFSASGANGGTYYSAARVT